MIKFRSSITAVFKRYLKDTLKIFLKYYKDIFRVLQQYYYADGQKYENNFELEIPCDWEEGIYNIHAYDNKKWGNMHKIGNFILTEEVKQEKSGRYMGALSAQSSGIESADKTPPGLLKKVYDWVKERFR